MSSRKLRRKYRPSSMPVQGKGRIVRRTLSHRREIDHGKQWYCLRLAAGLERRAEVTLRAGGFDVFRPVEDRWKIYKWRCSDVSLGWFGRYLFVGFGGHPRFDVVREADGVAGVLGVAGTPIAVRPEVLQEIADQVAGYREPGPIAGLSLGDKVKAQVGAWADFDGIVEELDGRTGRAKVRISLFGRDNIVQLDFVDLKAA